MAVILSLETATRNCSVAVSKDGETLALREHAGEGYGHAETLHLFINEVLAQSNLSFKDLDAVAVSRGPGSYTGLRIGVSAAKGLCVALGLPLIAVDTLRILAAKARIENGTIIPMIDARRMEVYCAAFDSNLDQVLDTQARILSEEVFDDIPGDLFFVGDSNQKAQTVLTKARYNFLTDLIFPSAAEIGELANKKFHATDFVDVAYFEPFYLKDFRIS
ncbi:MAG: tRNA (adenosine(37)-N6)-threonylcarbamoyltransferase complex dimerization subunit type 1 TsaB [Proteobacteria bacterium]|nr:MAG: tRNA (adenosine(37)-N6)-threonylcarbamoyltransferase complex dimerization subunit type 1 TsaB [Pseudomonadota bacterium]